MSWLHSMTATFYAGFVVSVSRKARERQFNFCIYKTISREKPASTQFPSGFLVDRVTKASAGPLLPCQQTCQTVGQRWIPNARACFRTSGSSIGNANAQ